MCVLQQKQIGKAHSGQERTRVHDVRVEKVTEVFNRKTSGAVSAPRSANSRSQTMHSGWCSVHQILHYDTACIARPDRTSSMASNTWDDALQQHYW